MRRVIAGCMFGFFLGLVSAAWAATVAGPGYPTKSDVTKEGETTDQDLYVPEGHSRDRVRLTGAAELFLAHLLVAHLAVPEPVRLRIQPSPVQFEGYSMKHDALIEQEKPGWLGLSRGWLIRYDQLTFASATRRRVEFVLAHELCHAIYEWDIVDVERLSNKEQRRRDARADNCARQALRAHKKCPGLK